MSSPATQENLGFTEANFIFEVLRRGGEDKVGAFAKLIEKAPAESVAGQARENIHGVLTGATTLPDDQKPITENVRALIEKARSSSPSMAIADHVLNSNEYASATIENERFVSARAMVFMIRDMLAIVLADPS